MIKLHRLAAVAISAAFFIAGSAYAQNPGVVTNHAFALGKGAGKQGFTSLLCASAQLAVGQSAADPICQTLTGDVTISAAGVTAIGAAKVTSAMLRNSGALSLIGRSANTSGVPADISAVAASSCAFIESGSTIICGQLATAGIANNAVTDAKLRQGVARSVIGVTGNAGANVADIQGAANQALVVNNAGTALAFGQVNLSAAAAVTGTLQLGNGGTGDTGTAWVVYTPSASCGTATITLNSARWKNLGKTTWAELSITFTAIGTCTSTMQFTLPNIPQSDGALAGREPTITGKGVNCSITSSTTTAICTKSDASNVTLNERWQISGVYENQ